jgi:phosphatidylserine decarboxylase
MSSARSKKKIAPFVAKHNINLNEYTQPENGYQSFNDFFYRYVKPEYRPIEKGAVSPADGRVLAFNTLSDTQQFFVKGSEFNLSTFLCDGALAQKYQGGAMIIIRLAPVDYHRFHFPVTGKVNASRKIKGFYYSVSPLALRKKMEIFCQNQREYCIQESNEYGDVLICDVGATLTGGIVQTYKEDAVAEKGSEKGYFAFGGSTLILLFEKGKIKFSEDLVKNTKDGYETFLKMGESIGVKQTD